MYVLVLIMPPKPATKTSKISKQAKKTASKPVNKVASKKHMHDLHVHSANMHGRVDDKMTLEKLREIAMTRGIQWGGLSKAKLIKKINNYYR
jgi:hypothetical protein